MANAASTDSPISEVQVEALVVMRIIKHSTSTFPTPATGMLVGMDVGAQLQITNTFPFPIPQPDTQQPDHRNFQDSYYAQQDAAVAAATAPRAKGNVAYANDMVKLLREVNVDAQGVGWYMSCSMGAFVSQSFVENQIFFQKAGDDKTVGLVFDLSRSSAGSLSLRAYRLSPSFVAAYREGKFSTESLQKSKLRYQDILLEFPVQIHNSHLLTSYLHQLPSGPQKISSDLPTSLAGIHNDPSVTSNPLAPNLDSLDLSLDPFLEKTCDLLLDSIESHQTEQNNFQYWQRALGREQQKIQAWQTKRKSENAARVAAKQTPLDENEWQKLFKLPVEPSRLEALLVGRQVEQYARQVDGFSAVVSGKMFGVKGNLMPGEV